MAQVTKGLTGANGAHSDANNTAADSSNPTINRKKQKRRQKQAARLAAEQQLNPNTRAEMDYVDNGHAPYNSNGHIHESSKDQTSQDGFGYGDPDFDDPGQYEPAEGEDLYYTDDEGRIYRNPYVAGQSTANGHPRDGFITNGSSDQKPKKKKSKARSFSQHEPGVDSLRDSATNPPSTLQVPPPPPPPPPPLSNAALRSAHSISRRDRIWNTSTAEERERIKEFWLSLGEEDRRSLVKVEKEAVLRKMKEQQKHSCSCTVCGRKRTAIEEELEVLYDAYYQELEQYANHTQTRLEDGAPIMPPSRVYGHTMGRLPPDRIPPLTNHRHPSKARIEELADDDEEGDDEEYSEEDDEGEEYSDDEPQEELRGPAADFFNFGNSLTVQGGILTVADDLLKNDGKKFIEMMEQLAERRMQREEEAQYAAAGLGHPSMHGGSNHGPLPDEEDYDEEDDEYDSQEEEEYDEDEMVKSYPPITSGSTNSPQDTMTEEQRMEEGRRMFQIFAARMFEQRVLTAYREKVARERQQKLIEELEEESRLDVQREAKKAKEAQKKKDKKKLQKQAKDEEKAKKDAERAAEEAAARAVEETKLEEQRQRKDEQRKKREAEKKAQDEEKARKEAEKSRRLQEEREKHAEQERRQREQKEREKRKREEAKKQEREEREAKEKEAREKKESEEKDRKEREAKAKAAQEAKERANKEELVAQQAAQAAKRVSQSSSAPTAPGLHAPQAPISLQSPHLHIATPVIPKAPTPVRPRQASLQESHTSSPVTPHFAPGVSNATSPSNVAQLPTTLASTGAPANPMNPKPSLHHPQPVPTLPPVAAASSMPHSTSSYASMAPAMMNGFPSSHVPMLPGLMNRAPIPHDIPMYSNQPAPIGSHYQRYPPPSNMPFPPNLNGMRPIQHGRGTQMDGMSGLPLHGVAPVAPPKINPQYHIPRDTMPTHSHSRQQSGSMEAPGFEHQISNTVAPTQPIARPAPIQRPASVAPHQKGEDVSAPGKSEIDDLSSHLGSSALLDDTDVPLSSDISGNRRGSAAPGLVRHGRLGFGTTQLFTDTIGPNKMENFSLGGQGGSANTWQTPQLPFGSPVMPSGHAWSAAPGAGWSTNNAFGVIGGPQRPNASRPVTVRLMVSQACKVLTANNPAKTGSGFNNISTILRQVEQLKPANEAPVQIQEMLDICDTEGNLQNGGGSFTIRDEGPRGVFVRFNADDNAQVSGRGPGEIGSPIQGNSTPAFRPFHPPGNTVAPSGF